MWIGMHTARPADEHTYTDIDKKATAIHTHIHTHAHTHTHTQTHTHTHITHTTHTHTHTHTYTHVHTQHTRTLTPHPCLYLRISWPLMNLLVVTSSSIFIFARWRSFTFILYFTVVLQKHRFFKLLNCFANKIKYRKFVESFVQKWEEIWLRFLDFKRAPNF